MYVDQESIFYYLTVTNEPLAMPEMPKDGNLAKACCAASTASRRGCAGGQVRAQLLGSGTIMYEVLKAQTILRENMAWLRMCGA